MRTFAQKPKAIQHTKIATSMKPSRSLSGQSSNIRSILQLQRTIGNQAVQRLLQSNAEELQAGALIRASTRFGHDFSRIPIFSPSAVQIQSKLTVSAPEDMYEQEADRIADQVMRLPKRKMPRTCVSSSGCPEYQATQEGHEHELLQTRRNQANDAVKPTAPPIVHDVLRSPGQPLDPAVRAYFEPRFSYDFSRVHIHTDATAAHSAKAVGAMAYTIGSDIVFGAGRYQPSSASGRRLIAHELVHTIQQRNPGVGGRDAPRLQREEEDRSGEEESGASTEAALRLVFVQQGQKMEHNANTIARAIGALKLPYFLPKDFQLKEAGSISCAKHDNVLKRAADYAKKLGRKVEMLHVVGHNYKTSGPACLHGDVTKEMAPYFSPSMTMVVHGCLGISRFPSGRFLKAIPGAKVYVHTMRSESGGPLDFTKVTQDEEGEMEKTLVKSVVDENIGFTEASIQAWIQRNIDWLRGKAGANNQKEAVTLIKDWFNYKNFPAFRSEETAAMARAVLANPENLPKVIVEGATNFLENWNKEKEKEKDPYEGL